MGINILLSLGAIVIISLIISVILFKRKLSNLKQRIAISETELQEISKKITDKKSDLEFVNNQLIAGQKTGFKLEAELKNNRESLNLINMQIDTKHNELKTLEETYQKQLNDKKEALKVEIDTSKEKRVSEMNQELAAYQHEIQQQKELLEEKYNKEKENFNAILEDYRSKRESIIKINKEEEEIRENAKFYTLNITSSDIADIEILERVKPSLSRPDILSKLIYKTYYEKPYTDLVGRVIGNNKITGIYKITNLINNKVYIGQAVDIAERWRQHIKRAVGAEPMTTNKLYPIMQETGPYNFSWQVVEECKKEELTSKEKYWIQYYDGQGYGYNMKG